MHESLIPQAKKRQSSIFSHSYTRGINLHANSRSMVTIFYRKRHQHIFYVNQNVFGEKRRVNTILILHTPLLQSPTMHIIIIIIIILLPPHDFVLISFVKSHRIEIACKTSAVSRNPFILDDVAQTSDQSGRLGPTDCSCFAFFVYSYVVWELNLSRGIPKRRCQDGYEFLCVVGRTEMVRTWKINLWNV